jgi:hypothetical protein
VVKEDEGQEDLPNVAVFLLRIREVPGSNLGPETGYPDWSFLVVFLSPSRKIPG